MDAIQITSLAIALASALGVLLAYFKAKPFQKERVGVEVEQAEVNIAQGTLTVAQGTVKLITGELEDQFVRMSAEQKALRAEMAAEQKSLRAETAKLRVEMQTHIDELTAELRAETAEKAEVKRENKALRERVQHLEDQVEALKNGGTPGGAA